MKKVFAIVSLLLSFANAEINECVSDVYFANRIDTNFNKVSSDNNNSNGGSKDNNISTIKSLKLEITNTTLNKDYNTTIDIKAKYEDNTIKTPNNIEWLITPKDAIRIKGNTLIALKDTNVTIQAKVGNTLSNKVHLNIYWEVDGHRLPPEPDPKVNNATLLGVDVNKNGVRDDVERWIYKTYHHPIERGIFMQSARAYQKILQSKPTKHQENINMINLTACQFYWKDTNNYIAKKYEYKYFSTDIKKVQFNTVKRLVAKRKYELSLSGGIYTLIKPDKTKCEFDENGILKAEQ